AGARQRRAIPKVVVHPEVPPPFPMPTTKTRASALVWPSSDENERGEESRGRPSKPGKEGRGPPILIVDKVYIATEPGHPLRLLGHDVLAAHSGSEPLELAMAHRPVAVMIGMGLPGMDVREVVRRLRSEAGLNNAQIIVMGGYRGERDGRRSAEAGIQL